MSNPVIAAKKPASVLLEPGKYYWCACGLSQKQPFCDGSHRSTDITPMAFEVAEKREYYLCQCKQSKKKPFCDGAHTGL
jgi:CDGSH iron-sulfur domain-containing protein 3